MSQAERTYEIWEVAQLTGVEPARLRAWERRYEVVRPRRLPNGYRAYSAEQVELLRAYARLVAQGARIGELAARPAGEVLARARAQEPDGTAHGALLAAVAAFDRDRLEALVAQQIALRGLRRFAEEIAIPLAEALGRRWAAGELSVAAEHLASEVVVSALKSGLRAGRGDRGPVALAAGLPGERHEWGILASLTVAQERGWRVHYLGPDLPLGALVEAAWALTPAAVALTAGTAETLERSLAELAELGRRLPPDTATIVGGAGAEAHRDLLRAYGCRTGLAAFAT